MSKPGLASIGLRAGIMSFLLGLLGCGLMTALFAVSCHRIVLLGAHSLPNPWGLYATGNVVRYFGYEILISVIVSLSGAVLGLVAFGANALMHDAGMIGADVMHTSNDPSGVTTFIWIASVPLAYLYSRLSMVLPATAIEHRIGLEAAWSMSIENGWRLTLALIFATLPLTLLGMLFSYLVDEEPSAPISMAGTLITILMGGVVVISLSCAYRQLQGIEAQAGESTEPLATEATV